PKANFAVRAPQPGAGGKASAGVEGLIKQQMQAGQQAAPSGGPTSGGYGGFGGGGGFGLHTYSYGRPGSAGEDRRKAEVADATKKESGAESKDQAVAAAPKAALGFRDNIYKPDDENWGMSAGLTPELGVNVERSRSDHFEPGAMAND